MSKDFMCQASDGSSGEDGIACGSSIEPGGEEVNYHEAVRKLKADGWEEIDEGGGMLWELERGDRYDHVITDVVIGPDRKTLFIKTATPTQSQIEERSDDVEVGQFDGGTTELTLEQAKAIHGAQQEHGQIEEQAASPRSDEVDAENKSASLTPHNKLSLETKTKSLTLVSEEIAQKFCSSERDFLAMREAVGSALLTVQKQERERCAKIADVIASIHSDPSRIQTAERIAAAILQGDDNAG